MLMLMVSYVARPGMRQDFYNAIQEAGLQKFFQSEAGCLRYDYYFPVNPNDQDEQNTICLFEIWKDVESHKVHASTEMFKKLCSLKEKYIERSVVTGYMSEEIKSW